MSKNKSGSSFKMRSNNHDRHSVGDDSNGSGWWNKMLSRRKLLRNVAIGAGLVGIVYACSDDDETDVQANALELQQKEGWNIGSADKPLALTDKQTTDSKGGQTWKSFLDPKNLLGVYQPTNAAWKPYFVPTLVQSLAQPTLRSAITPVCSNAMREAYSRGLGMREVLKESKNPQQTALLVDIAGAEAVAFAAAVADIVQPVLSFDNWPHPLGVVASQQTLGALLYYAQEFADKNATRPTNAPAILVLDSNRLAKYTDADNQFDNRYVAKLPTPDNLKTLGVTSVMYAVTSEAQKQELDDLNDDFATYQEKGVNISMLPLSRFQPATAQQANAQATNAAQTDTSATIAASTAKTQTPQPPTPAVQQPVAGGQPAYYPQPVYYYGGGPMFSPWFFHHYAMYSYYRPLPVITRLPATTYTRPSYQAARRPTMFSASATGGRSGIGKQRPAGFGLVGVRMSPSGGVNGVRAGRSGSFGNFRSGSFGRSFGGRSS